MCRNVRRIAAVVGMLLITGLAVVMSPRLAQDVLADGGNTPNIDAVTHNNLIVYPIDFQFKVPYIPPLARDLISPTPPGETLLPPAPILDHAYVFKPWEVLDIKPVPGIPDIFERLEFLLPFELLIITHEDFMAELAPLKAHKDYTDIPTRIYSWQHLVERFWDQGRDDPERIKKAIAAFRQGCGIRYVMLVGDADRFPVRYTMVYDPTHWGDGYVPSDLYYADLFGADGSTFDDWDGNGNGIFGEMQSGTWMPGSSLSDINLDGVDLYPDVAVGRIPASSKAEVATYVAKVITYEFAAYKAAWAQKSLFVVPGYLAGDGKYHEYPGSWAAKEDIGDMLAVAGVTATRLYDSRIEGLTPGLGDAEPTAANINAQMDAGVGFVNFSGHGNYNTWGPYTATQVAALANADRLPVVFAAACNTAQFHFGNRFLDVDGNVFDRNARCPVYNDAHRCYPANPGAARSPEPAAVQSAAYDMDSLAEEFLVKRSSGAVAYIGSYTGTQGGSQLLDRYFFEGYRFSMKPPPLGYLWNYAIRRYIDNDFHINFSTTSDWYPAALFHHIQKYMLFGDPSLRLGGVSRFQRADLIGRHAIVHDGWEGGLELKKVAGDYIEGTPNLGGTYTAKDGARHAVQGYMRTATYPLAASWGPDHKVAFYVDFSDTVNQSDDQRFEGYLFTRGREAMAGITWWNEIPFGFYIRKNRLMSDFGPHLVPGAVVLRDFLGTYRMHHDGWQGTLELWQPTFMLLEAGNVAGRYTAQSDGAIYNVRGTVKSPANAAGLPAGWPDHRIELYIDFAGTANLADDQKFEGYLFTRTKNAMAGVTWWHTVPFGFYALKQRAPEPRILANGASKTLNVASGQAVAIALQLDPGVLMDTPCDWWIVAATPFGAFSFVLPPAWQAGLVPALQAAPVALPQPVEIFRLGLPAGVYTFFFGLDDRANGVLDGNLWYDWVTVVVAD